MQSASTEPLSHFVTLEASANALATNKDGSQVVVAGRNVFKIFNVEHTRFAERLNLRGKNVDLSYSCADVAWCPTDDAVLATAATNGSVVTWNLNSVHKQDMKFQDHKRTVNKVCFHNTEPFSLLSGSQDGTMKLFDLRVKEAVKTFHSYSESVRDVQFCPHRDNVFAAVQENGYVQLWDLRHTEKCEKQFAAHSGPVFTCDWHPEDKALIATAGRDRTIKVWDTSFKENLLYCIQTIASVSRVKWRPQRKYQIASSSLVVDFYVNVWDVRRPYIPYASFTVHKDVASGFAWRSPKLLLTTGKDCMLYQHNFKDADRPAERANPVGLDIDPAGSMSYAFKKDVTKDTGASTSTGSKGATQSTPRIISNIMRKTSATPDRFRASLSDLCILKNAHELLRMDWFTETAQKYLLHGLPIPDLCERNATVAQELNRSDISHTWQVLKLLYTSGSVLISEISHMVNPDLSLEEKSVDSSQDTGKRGNSRNHHNSGKSSSRHVSGGSQVGNENDQEEDSDSGNTEQENTITYFSGELTQGDFFFGDGEAIFRMLDYTQLSTLPSDEDWKLPMEAFNIRHQLGDCSPPPELANMPSPFWLEEKDAEREIGANEEEEQNMIMALCNTQRFPPWDFTEIVGDMLKYYAELGDVQMSVSVLIVLGEKVKHIIPESLQEHWFHSYIELLSRFRLFNIANEVIALSSLPAINCLNQQSTTMHSICSKCNKIGPGVGWCCRTCKQVQVCCVCHQVVRGVYSWCQGCTHGGHLLHLKEWFAMAKQCPTGCGHFCEYT